MAVSQLHAEQQDPHWEERVQLAAAFRWAVRFNWHESVQNHFSLSVSDDGKTFLMNPYLKHFSRIRASDLVLINADDPATLDRPDAPEPTAWGLHGGLHRINPKARCALHVHPTYATVLATLADPTMPPIDQNTARWFKRVSYDGDYGGLALGDEAERCAGHLGDHQILLMGNHGVMAVGETVAQAFDALYYFERSAQTLIMAYQTGKPLKVLSDEVAERAAQQMNAPSDGPDRFLSELMAILDEEEPDYAT